MKRIVLTVLAILGILIIAGCTDHENSLPTSYCVKINLSGAASGESVIANVSEAIKGTTVTLTASLNSGRQVVLSVPGVTISSSKIINNEGTATFTMPAADVEVTATFSDIPTYAITISTGGAEEGELVSANVSEAAEGTTVILTASLNSGRQVELSVPGVPISPSIISSNEGTATFTMPAADVEVTANFFLIPGASFSHSANSVSFNMNYVPSGGTFIMGESVEETTQKVTLTKNFWMGETEVTQGLWEDVWGDDWPGNDPADLSFGIGVNYPAYYVSWYDSAAFCNLLTIADASIDATEQVYYSDAEMTEVYTKDDAKNKKFVYANWTKNGYRLPTEAEWEYAARYIDGINWNGGDHVSGGPIYTSDNEIIEEYAWFTEGSTYINATKEVRQKTKNALGLYDMSGNVTEWCFDWKADYSGGTEIDPKGGATGSKRLCRGGCWGFGTIYLRCADRLSTNPSSPGNGVGFRLCRTAD